MKCKIFCFYDHTDYEKILESIPNEASFKIITNDVNMKMFLEINNKTVRTLDEYFSSYSKINFNIYQNSKTTLQKYEKICREINYNEITIIQGLTHYLINDVLLFQKTKYILDKKTNLVFIFKKFSFLYFSILKYALEIGYNKNNTEYITIVKNKQIKIFTPESNYKFLERTNKILKYKNYFSIYSKTISKNTNKTILQFKAIKKLLPIVIQLSTSKFKNTIKKDSIESIFKKINKKISGLEISECGFFLSSDREDVIRPYGFLIKKMEKSFLVFTIDPITSSILDKQNISHLNFFEDIVLLANILKNTKEGSKMTNEIIRVANNNNLTLLFIKKINQTLLDNIYLSIAINMVMDNLLKKTNLKKCVVINGSILSEIIILLAKKYQIPSLTMECLLVDDNALSSMTYKTDVVCIYGMQGKKVLTNFGINNDKIAITGNPKYDYHKFIDQHKTRKFLCSSLNINSRKKIIAIMLSRWYDDEKWISRFIQFCNNNNCEVIIKLHPLYTRNHDIISNKIKFIKENCTSQNYHIIYNMNIHELIPSVDIIISDFSNVTIEALLLNKLVIDINFLKKELSSLQTCKFVASLYVEDYETLEKRIKETLVKNDFSEKRIKDHDAFIKLFNYYNDGNATNRISEVLKKLS